MDQIGPAAFEFARRRLVVRRRAMHRRRDVAVVKPKPVVPMVRVGLVGEAGGVKRAITPIAAPIPSKHPPRAVATVCRRRETDDQHACSWITESGQRLGPISLANIATRRLFC